MKITALTENISENSSICSEHGLSLFIETENLKILFDMGQTDIFYKNATTLGIDLKAANIAILSHGHYDHGGGLEKFLEINKTAPVYVNKHAFGDYFNANKKYIGLDKKLQNNSRIIYTDEETRISTGLTLFSCNEKKRQNSFGSFGLSEKVGDKLTPDKFLHEQYLLIEEKGKKILVSGCSHKGIIDIVNWFTPDILIGGFHFSKLDLGQKLSDAATKLASYNTTYYTCHCTGISQYEYMKKIMPQLNYISCGKSITI